MQGVLQRIMGYIEAHVSFYLDRERAQNFHLDFGVFCIGQGIGFMHKHKYLFIEILLSKCHDYEWETSV